MDARRLSICMLSDDFLPGATGVGSHLQVVSRHLAMRGHRVSVITSRRRGEPQVETWEGVRVFRAPTVKTFGFYQAMPSQAAIERIFADVKPDVVHQHYLGLMLIRADRVAARLGIPQVYTYHMTEDHLTQPLPMRPLRPLLAKKIVAWCNRADLVISVSNVLAGQLPAKGITTPIRYISNPIGFPDVPALPARRAEGPFTVFFAGRLNPEKNITFLLRAFRQLLRSIPDAVLWIAGEGAQKNELQRTCADLGMAAQVAFLGFLARDALSERYGRCDAFVLPSRVETQGLVAMEAMWFGKPVVVARSVVSASELVDDGGNGFVVEPDADEQLAARLVELARDAGLRERMGQAGRRKAQAYRPEGIVLALEQAYATLRRGAPA